MAHGTVRFTTKERYYKGTTRVNFIPFQNFTMNTDNIVTGFLFLVISKKSKKLDLCDFAETLEVQKDGVLYTMTRNI